jgi:BirA family biotin operon repressor/biotin-[acetyl-CoA-carboxylase] ligase
VSEIPKKAAVGEDTGTVPASSALEDALEPSDIDVRAIADQLWEKRFGRILLVDTVSSTNTALFEVARSGEPEGLVLVAEHQTRGRGRRDRRWLAATGKSLLLSALCRPSLAPERSGLVAVATGVALLDACQAIGLRGMALKWPNDLVHGRKKAAGILIEGGRDSAGEGFYVIGVGVNVHWKEDDFPPELAGMATSLDLVAAEEGLLESLAEKDQEGARMATESHTEESRLESSEHKSKLSRGQILARFLTSLGDRISQAEQDPDGLVADYRENLSTIGQEIIAKTDRGEVTGEAVDVDEAGDLVVRRPDGTPYVITAADVTELRPAAS